MNFWRAVLAPRLRYAWRDLAAADGRALERPQHALGQVAGHLDKREALEQLDRADRPAWDVSLVGDRADDVRGPHAVVAADVEVQPGHAALGAVAAPAARLALLGVVAIAA